MPYAFGNRAFGIPEYGMAGSDRFRPVRIGDLIRPGEMAVEYRAGAAKGNRFPGEQGGVEAADGVRIEDARMFLGGGLVKGGEAVDVRGGADHGLPAGDAGHAPGEAVRAAEMPRSEADHMAAAFRAGQHGGIAGLVPEQRGNLAHGYSGRADEDMRIELPPVGGQGRVKGFPRRVYDVRRIRGARGMDRRGQAEPGGDFLGADNPLVGKGIQGAAPVKGFIGEVVSVAM